jgi:excisionase family DNA binding protein
MQEQLIRIPALARILDVPDSTIYELVFKELPVVRVGRHIRFSEPCVREFIRRGGTRPKEDLKIPECIDHARFPEAVDCHSGTEALDQQ